MRIWILLGVFLGILIIAFGIFAIRISESTAPTATSTDTGAAPITDIHFLDSYKKGVHTIKGTATVPNACITLSAAITAPSGTSSPIRIDLNAPADSGICLQAPTANSFSLSVTADQGVPIAIYANGVLATTTE